MLRRLSVPAILLVCLLLGASRAPAPPPPPPDNGDSGFMRSGDFEIETDQTNFNLNTGDFTMPHRVHATRPGTDIVGDHALGNSKRKVLTLSGNVVVHQIPTNGSASQPTSAVKLGPQASTLTTNTLVVNWGNHEYTAEGNVRFIQGTRTVTADRGTLNDVTHNLQLSGNVHIVDNQQTVDAKTIQYNTRTEAMHASGDVSIVAPIDEGPVPPAPLGPTAPRKHRRS